MVSIWHWIIFLLVLAIPIGTALVAARSNKDATRRVGRLGFLKRWAVLLVANLAFGAVLGLIVGEEMGNALSLLVAGPISIGFMAYWSVDRLRDIGAASIRPAYFVGVPLVGFVIVLYLSIKKGAPEDTSSLPEPVTHPPA